MPKKQKPIKPQPPKTDNPDHKEDFLKVLAKAISGKKK
jgi:hypothetical protein